MNSIKRREYAAIQNRQFDPSDRGRVVVSFLDDYFSEYFQYDFTAKMEESLDLIARGELDWKNLLDNFWSGLEPNLVKVEGLSNREVLDSLNESLSKQLFRENSNCPKCNEGNLTLKNSAKFTIKRAMKTNPNLKVTIPNIASDKILDNLDLK